MKKIWWRVPLYCCAAGWVSFQLMVRFLGRFAIVTLPDGTLTSDNTTWMLLSGLVFLAAVLAGGLIFFRKLTRREIFLSACVMVAINAVMNLLSYARGGYIPIVWMYISEWSSFPSQLLFRLNVNEWISAVLVWATPWLFVPFGKKQ